DGRTAELLQRAANDQREVLPRGDPQLHPYDCIPPRLEAHHALEVDRQRQHEALVVVRVIADQVDASRRAEGSRHEAQSIGGGGSKLECTSTGTPRCADSAMAHRISTTCAACCAPIRGPRCSSTASASSTSARLQSIPR